MACGEDPAAPPPVPPPPDPPRPTTLTVTPNRAELTALGATVQLSAEVRDQNGQTMAGVPVAWSSGDAAVATVDSAGLVTGIRRGETRIVARADGVSGDARVTVQPRVDSVAVVPPSDTIAPGDTLRLVATAYDPNGHPIEDAEFEWSSSDVSVAQVDSSGLILGTGEGVATITAAAFGAAGTAEITAASPDRAALEAFYETTGGPRWRTSSNWLTAAPVGEWWGVDVDGNGRVRRLELTNNNLQGFIPPELVDLANLRELILHHNLLQGEVPPELGRLVSLEVLDLGYNALVGSIPPELGELANLRMLALHANHLSGSIPPQLGRLASLEELSLARQSVDGIKSLTGPIPPELGELANLRVLQLASNLLTGPIPSELGRLSSLEALSLLWNPITGPIPPELGALTNLKKLYLNLLPNMSGPIPSEFGDLANLELMDLSWSSLTGSIPPELGNLAKLKTLYLGENDLTGPIPPELGGLSNLEVLGLGGNEWWSPIPPEFGDLKHLQHLNFNDSDVTGSIPPELGRLSELRGLYLGLNHLTGIPPELAQLDNLEDLWLEYNQLAALPHGVPSLRSLTSLNLSGNHLTSDGLPPGAFSGLPNLQELNLERNQLRELPAGLFLGLPRLGRLELEGNPGSPFTLALEIIRTDNEELSAPGPATVEIRLAEGAPVDLRVPLSVHGGAISSDRAVLQTGTDRSTGVTVTPDANNASGTEVVVGPLPTLPPAVSGIEFERARSLVLFGDVPNRAPIAERHIPWLRMQEAGDSRQVTPSSYFHDPDGDELEYSALSSDPRVVSVSVTGRQLTVVPESAGSATITVAATDAGGLTAESSLPVSVRGGHRGLYAIDLILVDPVNESVRAAFSTAVDYWESILAGTELPDFPIGEGVPLGCRNITTDQSMATIDDLVIVAAVEEGDGRGGVLASASVCGVRAESQLPLIGTLKFDVADLALLSKTGNMEEVIVHEIGHVLGIGILWDDHGLLINPSRPNDRGADTHFRGPMAIAAFDEAGGEIYTGGEKVPVENFAGRGSGDSHWRESVLDHELMTPALSLGVPNPLSAMTVQSLADMGYTVDLSLAEPFLLPGAAARAPGEDVRKIEYGDDVRRGPIMVFGRDGRVVRVIRN